VVMVVYMFDRCMSVGMHFSVVCCQCCGGVSVLCCQCCGVVGGVFGVNGVVRVVCCQCCGVVLQCAVKLINYCWVLKSTCTWYEHSIAFMVGV